MERRKGGGTDEGKEMKVVWTALLSAISHGFFTGDPCANPLLTLFDLYSYMHCLAALPE